MEALVAERDHGGILGWWHDADVRARRAFVAASLGWMLDSFDVMLYAMVLASLIEDPTLHLSLPMAGILNSATLLAAAAGGIAFGVIADRLGRKRALMAAVLISVVVVGMVFAIGRRVRAALRVLGRTGAVAVHRNAPPPVDDHRALTLGIDTH
jgi:MFS family permease